MKVYIVICEMLDDEKYKVFRKIEDAETYLNAQIGKYFLQMLEDFNGDGDRDNFISEMNDAYTAYYTCTDDGYKMIQLDSEVYFKLVESDIE